MVIDDGKLGATEEITSRGFRGRMTKLCHVTIMSTDSVKEMHLLLCQLGRAADQSRMNVREHRQKRLLIKTTLDNSFASLKKKKTLLILYYSENLKASV